MQMIGCTSEYLLCLLFLSSHSVCSTIVAHKRKALLGRRERTPSPFLGVTRFQRPVKRGVLSGVADSEVSLVAEMEGSSCKDEPPSSLLPVPAGVDSVLSLGEFGRRQDLHSRRLQWLLPSQFTSKEGDGNGSSRKKKGAKLEHDRVHPIFNFLFEYYHFNPADLKHWSPGVGVGVVRAEVDGFSRRMQRFLSTGTIETNPTACVQTHTETGTACTVNRSTQAAVYIDPRKLSEERKSAVRWQIGLLKATQSRPPKMTCFGLHEWAMLYRPDGAPPSSSRFQNLPLRIPQTKINEVVENGLLSCTHYDAYRFFPPEGKALNPLQLSRQTVDAAENEQPACLHASMDLFKWLIKLAPLVPSDLVLEALHLAIRARILDMRASPYDLEAWEEQNEGRRKEREATKDEKEKRKGRGRGKETEPRTVSSSFLTQIVEDFSLKGRFLPEEKEAGEEKRHTERAHIRPHEISGAICATGSCANGSGKGCFAAFSPTVQLEDLVVPDDREGVLGGRGVVVHGETQSASSPPPEMVGADHGKEDSVGGCGEEKENELGDSEDRWKIEIVTSPVMVENEVGRREYQKEQYAIMMKGVMLRKRVIEALEQILVLAEEG